MKRVQFAIVLSLVVAGTGVSCSTRPLPSSRQMPDGRHWTTDNLNVEVAGSHCYEDAESNCRRYGRLYTWDSAKHGCRSLGEGWRLPTNEEWQRLAKHYGGVRGDSNDEGSPVRRFRLLNQGRAAHPDPFEIRKKDRFPHTFLAERGLVPVGFGVVFPRRATTVAAAQGTIREDGVQPHGAGA